MKQIDFPSLSEELSKNLDLILDHFGIRYRYEKGIYSFPCPVHGGEGHNCRIKPYKGFCNWTCWSQHCEDVWGKSIYGLVAALLSEENPDATKRDAVEFCIELLNLDEEDLQQSYQNRDRNNFIGMANKALMKNSDNKRICSRKELREKLSIPSSYFIKRGYTPEILDKYDVGFCSAENEMKGRVVFPIYDNEHKFVIGTVGRTLKPHCEKCGMYHELDSNCPTSDFEKRQCGKWKNSFNFNASSAMFNYWFAKDKIKEQGTVILVEGQGDVISLEQAGIHIGLGIFGSSLKPEQEKILQSSGAMNVILAFDPDKAGKQANEKIKKQLERYYNVYVVDLTDKDIGDLNEEEIRETFEPIFKKVIL